MPLQPAAHASQATPDQHAQDAQYYRQILHDLVDMGAALARAVHQQALAQAANAEAAPNATIAFDRIARTIRRTIALAQRLGAAASAPPATTDRATTGRATTDRATARKRIIRDVEDAIGRIAEGAEAGRLHAELLDRLDAPELDDDLATRPVAEIIAEICRDLGLASQNGIHPWKRRTPADIAELCARAHRPASMGAPPDTPSARLCAGGARPHRGASWPRDG